MAIDLRNSFRVSFITSDGAMPAASVAELLTGVQSRPVWDGASISPVDAQFPLVHVDWHQGHGFVLQCYEDEESWSYFLVTSPHVSPPSIEVELGGQALERWPRELFVSAERANRALNHFLDFGKQDPKIRGLSGSESMPSHAISCGTIGKDEKPGNVRIGPRMRRFEMDGCLKAHGVFFDLTLEDVRKGTDAALASSR